MAHLRRREFIGLLGGAAAWPVAALAQHDERVRRIGVFMATAAEDAESQLRFAAFMHGLQQAGWRIGQNVQVDNRFAAGRADRHQELAKELVALQPDVILAQTPPIIAALQRESRAIPIVFVSISDPIGAGLVASLARPGGNATGLLLYEAGITGKWLAMLKEIAPRLARVALLGNPKTTNFDYFLRAAEAAAPALAVEIVPGRIETAGDIERTLDAFAGRPNGGLLLPPDATTIFNRELIIALAARHRLPAVYPLKVFVEGGGLMSYSTDQVEIFRNAAGYVDRILRGAKPADLPVQAPTKYATVVNLKTAKALGFEVPPSLLVRADEVIE